MMTARINREVHQNIVTATVNIETIPGESDIDSRSVSFIIGQSEVRVGESKGERKIIGEGATVSTEAIVRMRLVL